MTILGGVGGQNIADGENEADEPGKCDAKEHLQDIKKSHSNEIF